MKNEITRRDALNQSFIAGLALTVGFLGLSGKGYGQAQNPGLTVNNLKIPKKLQFRELFIDPPSYKPINFSEKAEELRVRNNSFFKTDSSDSKNVPVIQIPAIEKKIKLSLNISEDFLKNNIEELLDQAANLLDRGIKDREEWDNLSIRIFYLEMEINQFLELDKIHDEETKNGYYDLLLEEKLNLLNIENLSKAKLEQLTLVFAEMFEKRWTKEEMNKYVTNKGEMAFHAGGSTRDTTYSAIEKSTTLATEEYDLAVQYVYNFVQKEGLLTSKEQAKLREKLLKKQVKWENIDRDFRLMRTDVDRKYEYLKLIAFNAEDGVLNLKKRKDPLELRFMNDFSEAYARLKVASVGLQEVFGYSVDLPSDLQTNDIFDRCILWNRNAINWLIRFGRFDQSFVIPISLKSLVFKNQSKELSSQWEAMLLDQINFNINESEFFENYTNVRIKGISVSAQLNNKRKSKIDYACMYQGMIQSEIRVPCESYYRHDSNKDKEVKVDQSKVPIVKFNRIASRNFIRQPDVVGSSLFNNLSPFGKWSIKFPQMKQENLIEKINFDDIYLDLYITARRNPNKCDF